MDPFSIAASSSAIVGLCFKVARVIFTFVVSDLLQEILGLSRVSEAISQTWTQHPKIVAAEAGSNSNLWASVKATIDDCKSALGKLDTKLDEVQKGGFLGRGFLRKPTKLVKLNIKMKDILLFKQQVHSYNNAMQSALQMINVCLLLNGNSSQESIIKVLDSLKTQIGRVETALQERGYSEGSKYGISEENTRFRRNLQELLQAAGSFHSNASVIVSDGARSTVWGGSVMGEPLSVEQYRNIQDWISPVVEENEQVGPETSVLRNSRSIDFPGDNDKRHPTNDSDTDSDDIERHLTKKFEELALKSFEQRDYKKAETFLRKLIDRGGRDNTFSTWTTSTNTWLAYACGCQGKWEEAESILVPIAMAKGAVDTMAFHGLDALAMVHLATGDHEAAIRHCKRAVWGNRKFWGKTGDAFYESMALLVQIYEIKGDSAEAEGCRSFIPVDYSPKKDLRPVKFIELVLAKYLPKSIILANPPSTEKSPAALYSMQNTLNTTHQGIRNQPAHEPADAALPRRVSRISSQTMPLTSRKRDLSTLPPSESRSILPLAEKEGLRQSEPVQKSTVDQNKTSKAPPRGRQDNLEGFIKRNATAKDAQNQLLPPLSQGAEKLPKDQESTSSPSFTLAAPTPATSHLDTAPSTNNQAQSQDNASTPKPGTPYPPVKEWKAIPMHQPEVNSTVSSLPQPPPLSVPKSIKPAANHPQNSTIAPPTKGSQQWLLPPIEPRFKGKKCLLLDLDETLVHGSLKRLDQVDFTIPVEIEGQFHNVYVIKRPGVDQFMKRVGKLYEIVIFTESVSKI